MQKESVESPQIFIQGSLGKYKIRHQGNLNGY